MRGRSKGVFKLLPCHRLPIRLQHQSALQVPTQRHLVGSGVGKRGGSKTNTVIAGIVDRIEAFEEGLTVDEIKTLAGVRAKITDDKVDATCSTTDLGVEGTGPDLGVGSQLKGGL